MASRADVEEIDGDAVAVIIIIIVIVTSHVTQVMGPVLVVRHGRQQSQAAARVTACRRARLCDLNAARSARRGCFRHTANETN